MATPGYKLPVARLLAGLPVYALSNIAQYYFAHIRGRHLVGVLLLLLVNLCAHMSVNFCHVSALFQMWLVCPFARLERKSQTNFVRGYC